MFLHLLFSARWGAALCIRFITEGQNIYTKKLINTYTTPHHPQAGDLPSYAPKKKEEINYSIQLLFINVQIEQPNGQLQKKHNIEA